MTRIIEARQRLDKTLSSSALSDTAILSNLVRKQLHKTISERLSTDEVVEKKSNQLLKLFDALRSAKGERTTKIVEGEWKVKQDTPRFRVLYREGPEGTPYHSLCLDGIIDGPMSHALVLAWEVPTFHEWWPQFAAPTFKITESRWLERDTVGGDHSVLRFKVPWPFAMREVILSAYELEYFDEDLVAILYNSAPDVPDEKVDGISSDQIPDLQLNVVRMDLFGGFVLQKITEDCTFFRVVVDLDMKLDLVPPWLINFIARQLVGHGYKLYQKAVAGLKGSSLEKLVDSDPMYKRIQAISGMTLNIYEPTLVPMMPSRKDATGYYKEPYKQEEIDSVESAFKTLSDQELPKAFKQSPETFLSEEKQNTGAILPESNLDTNNAPISSRLHNVKHDSIVSVPSAETNSSEIVTVPLEPEQHLSPASEADGPSDPEVVWALGVLEKFIAHFASIKAASQTSESNGTLTVQNGIADNNPEPVCSMAKVDPFFEAEEYLDNQDESSLQRPTLEQNMCGTRTPQSAALSVKVKEVATVTNEDLNGKESGFKLSPLSDEFDKVKKVGSEKIVALPEGKEITSVPCTRRRGFRFFRFRKRHKEGKSSKRQDTSAEVEPWNQVHEI